MELDTWRAILENVDKRDVRKIIWGRDASDDSGDNPELKPIVIDVLALKFKAEPYFKVEVEGT